MNNVTTVGFDLAKNVFSMHGVDSHGKVVICKTVGRGRLLRQIVQLPPCVIGLEACSGAHEWARQLRQLGHDVRLMAPRFVAPYRKSGKNDGNDAEAICEAVSRPSMRFVPIKSVEQQAVLTLHRVRQGFIEERTATINRIQGLETRVGQYERELEAHTRADPRAQRIQTVSGIGTVSASAPPEWTPGSTSTQRRPVWVESAPL